MTRTSCQPQPCSRKRWTFCTTGNISEDKGPILKSRYEGNHARKQKVVWLCGDNAGYCADAVCGGRSSRPVVGNVEDECGKVKVQSRASAKESHGGGRVRRQQLQDRSDGDRRRR